MIYPSSASVALMAAGAAPAFLIALLWPGLWFLGLAWLCGVLAFMAVDAATGGGPGAATVNVEAPASVGVSQDFAVEVTASLRGQGPVEARLGSNALLLRPEDASEKLELSPSLPGAFQLRAVRRGAGVLGPLWLRWRGPFGLTWKQRKLDLDRQVSVLPDIAGVQRAATALLNTDADIGESAHARFGGGQEFESMTDFQPGMERRMIDWKRSARHGALVAKEYRPETNNTVVLAIDSGRLMCEPVGGLPRIDRAIGAALLTAFFALRKGDAVRLFSFDARPRVASGPVSSTTGFRHLQNLASRIEYSTNETNFTLGLTTVNAELNRRSLVVIFTDFVDPASAELMLRSVGQLTQRHLVLFLIMKDDELETLADAAPDSPTAIARAVSADTMIRERQVVIERLRLLGAHVIEADYRNVGPALIDRYIELLREQAL